MSMTHKARLAAAFNHAAVDRLPTQINYTAAMGQALAAHYQVAVKELPALLDNHLVRVDVTHAPRFSRDRLVRYDWWGAGHDTVEEGYFIRDNPLAVDKDPDAYAWPDPSAPGLLDDAARTIAAQGAEYFILPNLGFALFERAWSLRGFEQFLMDMALDPAYAAALLDRITEIQLALIERFLALGVDGGYFGDDYGAQKGLLFSPAAWRKLIKPRLARLFAPFRAAGLPVIMHSDGQIQPILGDLVEIGLTVLNPVQPEVLNHRALRQGFGDKLAFYGGISTQTVLPHGGPAEVRRAVANAIADLAPGGDGPASGALAPDDGRYPARQRRRDVGGIPRQRTLRGTHLNGLLAQTREVLRAKGRADASRKDLIAREFQQRFCAPPALWVRAPGRVDLMGSHTDYNLGYVMTMTLDRDTWLALRPRRDRWVAVQSLDLPGSSTFSLDAIDHDRRAPWANYVRGMAWAMEEAGFRLTGFDGLIHSTIPFGSGLSSSAALEMAAGVAFQITSDLDLDPVRLAILGQRAENRFVGVNCGILDQYSSALGEAGSALLLDCRGLHHTVAPIAEGIAVVICDTAAPRSLVGSEYGERRAQCEAGVAILRRHYPHVTALRDATSEMLERHRDELPEVVERRCRFIIEEDERVLALAGALSTGDRARLGVLLAASYAGARDLYEIGAPVMEAMMDAMLGAPGVIGARQAGAGFGGCMIALVEQGQVDAFGEAVKARYRELTGIEPEVYDVRAAPGAGMLHLT